MAQTSIVSKVINGTPFESIIVSGPVSVELIESDNNLLEATGSYDFINGIHTSWSNKELQISFDKDEKAGDQPIKVYVHNLTSIQAEDGAKINTPKPLHCRNINIKIIGDGYARIVNHGSIRVIRNENTIVSNFAYKAE